LSRQKVTGKLLAIGQQFDILCAKRDLGVWGFRKIMRLASVVGALVCAALAPPVALAQTCPSPLQSASRFVLVTVPAIDSSSGTMRLFERAQPGSGWRAIGTAEPVMLGRRGVAWALPFRELANRGEPLKTEGDRRTPAGVFAVGAPFGFASSTLAHYVQLQPDSVCVEDPSSPAYNTIAPGSAVGRVNRKENMRQIPLYRRGLMVDYPTDAGNKAGSCIFMHIWRSASSGTHGCVVMPEERVAVLQRFANQRTTAVAVLPEAALGRFAGCLPRQIDEARSTMNAPAAKPPETRSARD
jgi:L,D-peptidoglycan transpeptidase YkuD (ErfK/YbiS/YcfS/YnhG family)